jgi:hypothetical protein
MMPNRGNKNALNDEIPLAKMTLCLDLKPYLKDSKMFNDVISILPPWDKI